ncbi:MvdC/MvdD family ATP grasp protein [Polyangium spumosum]|uniref:MvdD family ATP-grasp ribosomal peptide maturase n=1 Tax=Polyangium spumosum TaxID=889282 RepID=A0A6N7PKX6_9BACT|nr:MvdD family ATP-grasp ribosomal peptide maturase [Polyangium spumosum]MRG91486.1 MvdD family ATP-grasp ribosomal peptide maturase [Polyangium spumosum]
MKVLILTHKNDAPPFIERVADEVRGRGAEPVVFYLSDFPVKASITFGQEPEGEVFLFNGHAIGAGDAIWGRRYHKPALLPEAMHPGHKKMVFAETERFLQGVLAACPAFKVDPYARVRGSDHKPLHQRIFREAGIRTPRTLGTNDPAKARAFLASCPGGAIVKMLSPEPFVKDDGKLQVVMTTEVGPETLARLEQLRLCPMYFQERVEKAFEVRATVFGNKIFAARIDSPRFEGADVDWRNKGLETIDQWRHHDLPRHVEEALGRYQDMVGMQYGAADFIVTPEGDYVLLEVNPAGEFFWLEANPPHHPMVAALVDVLVGASGARRAFTGPR